MPVSDNHPQFGQYLEVWQQLRDTFDGERKIKAEKTKYLPATSGMIQDGSETSPDTPGGKAYAAYLKRAAFHNFMEQAVHHALGVMHTKPAVIELPPAMEPLIDRATVNGDSLELLLQKINEEQLITGRIGLLLDLPAQPTLGQVLPYIATYRAERIRNWDDGAVDLPTKQTLNLVILDETEFERKSGDFGWEQVDKYRVLQLGDLRKNETEGVYTQTMVTDRTADPSPELALTPVIRGQALREIPFVFINSMDLLPDVDNPPLETLSNLCLTIYRGEADYRQALFMQGQDTLVMIGVADDGQPVRLGAGAAIKIASTEGDAKFIGVSATGLPEMRTALENDKAAAASLAGEFVERNSVESGDALRRRIGARTATLTDIANASAAGLQKVLRIAAVWMGQDPEKVVVSPNLEFTDEVIDTAAIVDLMTAKNAGLPLSFESIHERLRENEYTDKTFEEELDQIEAEHTLMPKSDMGAGFDDNGDPIDPNPQPAPDDPNADPNMPAGSKQKPTKTKPPK